MTGLDVDYIVIHCSATMPSMDIGASEIDRWHREKGWDGVGYHLIGLRDGRIEPGRPLDMQLLPGWQIRQGAQVADYNSRSVGYCLIGGLDEYKKPAANYTERQWVSLRIGVGFLARCFPAAEVVGHRDLDAGKACPCFDVRTWWQASRI